LVKEADDFAFDLRGPRRQGSSRRPGKGQLADRTSGGTIIALVYIFPYLPLCSTYLKLVFEHSAEIEKRVNKMAGKRMFN
jgi:hypothetical protein